jgi:hypothetical protein
MKNLFVPYKIALKLKEKGFDEPCIAEYIMDGVFSIHAQDAGEDMPPIISEFNAFTNSKPNWIPEHFKASAPMYAQVIDWLREKNKLFIILDCKNTKYPNGNWECEVHRNNEREYGHFGFETYYEALNKAIEEALNLI